MERTGPTRVLKKIALVKLDPEQKDLIRACEEGGFFVDAENAW